MNQLIRINYCKEDIKYFIITFANNIIHAMEIACRHIIKQGLKPENTIIEIDILNNNLISKN